MKEYSEPVKECFEKKFRSMVERRKEILKNESSEKENELTRELELGLESVRNLDEDMIPLYLNSWTNGYASMARSSGKETEKCRTELTIWKNVSLLWEKSIEEVMG